MVPVLEVYKGCIITAFHSKGFLKRIPFTIELIVETEHQAMLRCSELYFPLDYGWNQLVFLSS